MSTRLRSDLVAALKRASLERQLEGAEPSTLREILEDAKSLSIVLKAGALPAPVYPQEERTVGSTLGEDAIVLADELATRVSLPEALDSFMQRRYQRCKTLVDISAQLSIWERDDDVADADVAGLTRQSFEVAAAPI